MLRPVSGRNQGADMKVDEVEAFRLAMAEGRRRGLPWQPPYSIHLESGRWVVNATSEYEVAIDSESGEVLDAASRLDPAGALSAAKAYAIQVGVHWKPAFTIELSGGRWLVGSSMAQLGGQVRYAFDDAGHVVQHQVNPK